MFVTGLRVASEKGTRRLGELPCARIEPPRHEVVFALPPQGMRGRATHIALRQLADFWEGSADRQRCIGVPFTIGTVAHKSLVFLEMRSRT